jgi:hypothetical protein
LGALLAFGAGGSGAAAVERDEAGSIEGHPWHGRPGITENVAEIVARQRRIDRRSADRPGGIEVAPAPGERPIEPRPGGRSTARASVSGSGAAVVPKSSFDVGTSFLGAQISDTSPEVIPPDPMGAVGADQVVVAVNGRIRVFDKQGNLGGLNVSDNAFWSSVRDGKDVTDPQVEYDRLSGRWFVVAVNVPASGANRVMIAVSSGSTITNSSSFTFFQFTQDAPPPATQTNGFADYPSLGVDPSALYVGANVFAGTRAGFLGTTGYVIDKADLLAETPTLTVTAFRNIGAVNGTGAGPWSPQGVLNQDPSATEGYFIGIDNVTFGQLDIRRVTDPAGTPTMSSNLTVAVPPTTFPTSVPAQGSTPNLDAVDDRLFEAMIAREPGGAPSLWTAHNIEVNSSGVASGSGNRDGARWYELGNLTATPGLVQAGTLLDPAASSPRFFWMPSIAANGQRHASLNSSTAGAGRFAAIAGSGHLASDPLGSTQAFDITQSSSSPYDVQSGSQPQRWGDYSQTVVDPTDNQTFWTFQEYANDPDSWGVRVIELEAPPPATPTASDPSAVDPGEPSVTVEVTGTSIAGSGFFDPGPDTGGPGYPNHISASVSGGVTVNSITYDDPTHVTLELDTTLAGVGARSITITNPDGRSRTGTGILAVGDVVPPDTTPPETTIDKHPKKKTTKSRARFKFHSSEAGSSFECKRDKKAFKPCGSPKKYKHLDPGKHRFKVRATDPEGKVDPSPAKFKWKVTG